MLGYCLFYIRQAAYVFSSVCLFVCLLSRLRKNDSKDFHKIQQNGGTWATEKPLAFGGNLNYVTLGLLRLGASGAETDPCKAPCMGSCVLPCGYAIVTIL